jgi:hypothetical protein
VKEGGLGTNMIHALCEICDYDALGFARVMWLWYGQKQENWSTLKTALKKQCKIEQDKDLLDDWR